MSETAPFILKIHHNDDIRKFHVESFQLETVTKLLTSTYSTPFTLKYNDSDNDHVTIITQNDINDAIQCSEHKDQLVLFLVDQKSSPVAAPIAVPIVTASATPATEIDQKSASASTNNNDLSSHLSHAEISTLLTECLSDMTILTALPSFLTSFIDALINNISTSSTTPMSTSWQHALTTNPTIRDHVILSVLLPRASQAVTKADIKGFATRIPMQTLQMVKGFIPMLPMFLPSLIPMITQMIAADEMPSMSDITSGTHPAMANNPLMAMLGPMFSQLQQPPVASNTSSASNSSSSASASSSSSSSSSSASASVASPPTYTSELQMLAELDIGSPDLNLSLLQQHNGDVEKVVDILTNIQ